MVSFSVIFNLHRIRGKGRDWRLRGYQEAKGDATKEMVENARSLKKLRDMFSVF